MIWLVRGVECQCCDLSNLVRVKCYMSGYVLVSVNPCMEWSLVMPHIVLSVEGVVMPYTVLSVVGVVMT